MKTRFWGRLICATLLSLSSGCLPRAVWLPDSSGILFTSGTDSVQVWHHNIAANKTRRLLSEDRPGDTAIPGVSPGGRHFAIARLVGDNTKQQRTTLQVIVCDLDGKEVKTSRPFPWRRSSIGNGRAEIYWRPAPGDQMLIYANGLAGIYDLTTDQIHKLERPNAVQPVVVGGNFLRPDGAGFLLGGGSLNFVDWKGKVRPIQLKNFQLDGDQNRDLQMMATWPTLFSSTWENKVAIVSSYPNRIRIDTDKLEARVDRIEAEMTADKKIVQHKYSFGRERATVRLVELVPRDFRKAKDRKDAGFGEFRLETLKPDQEKPIVLLNKVNCVQMVPSPNKKLLALDCLIAGDIKGDARRLIMIVNQHGEVVARVGPMRLD